MKTKDKNLFLKVIRENIPEELKRYNHWVCWKAEEQNDKVKKVPYSPKTGRRASINKPDTWADFNTAFASYVNGKEYDGIGFVLTEDDPFASWDLDDCREIETGYIMRKAQIIIKKLDSYTEVSPSGTGLRSFCEAKFPDGGRKTHKTEVYGSKRYMTLTGAHLEGTPKKIEDRQSEIDWLYNWLFKSQEKSAKERQSIQEQDAQDIFQKKLHKAFKSNNGVKFKQLYNGDTSGYPSQSEADLALCSHLAFWLNKDQYLVDKAFRASGLYREKWDQIHSSDGRAYAELTIQKAISGTDTKRTNSNATSDTNYSKPLSFISVNELLSTKFDHHASIIGGNILPEGGGLILAGESDVGKTLLMNDLTIHLALGRPLLGGKFSVIKPRKIVIFQVEIILRMLQKRIKKMLGGLGIKTMPDNIIFSDTPFSYDMMDKKCVDQMIAGIEKYGADVIIADPLSSFHSVNENDNSQMRNVLDKFTHISRITGAASIIVHHFGKPVETRSNSYRLRGASSIKDWADTVITLEPKRDENKTLRLLKFEKIRHGKKLKPVFLERDDETLLYKRTEDNTTIPPQKIGAFIKENLNGRVEKQSVLLEALADNFECSTRTAQRALREAVRLEMVQEKKIGNRKEYSVS